MRFVLHIVCLFVSACVLHGYITYIEVRLPLQGFPAPSDTPWPLPREWNNQSTINLTINPSTFYFESNAGSCDIIVQALKRYKDIVLLDGWRTSPLPGAKIVEKVTVSVDDPSCGYPSHLQNEKYKIVTTEQAKATIESETIWGALRGLETFSQLVYSDYDKKANTRYFRLKVTEITDYPRFKFRSLLLDTARHFQPKEIIKKNLDAMAYNKFNVFHWHMVDDQSWPIEMKCYPNLTTTSAYSPAHVYKEADVKEIIEYARYRGIRVIPEIDTPGHTQAIGRAMPSLLTPCNGQGKPGTPNYPEHASYEMLNPSKNHTYEVMKNIFQEVRNMFQDEYIHLGMDEVYYACWNKSDDIIAFQKEKGYKSVKEVEQHYVSETLKNVKDIGYKYMIWQDPIDNDVKAANDTIVSVWKDKSLDSKMKYWQEYIGPIAKKKYQIVLSACWYLNYVYKVHGVDWDHFYKCDPLGFEGSEQYKEQLIGGEACMWGEYNDGTNLLAKLWPRASAVGERLWSNEDVQRVEDAQFRIDLQRCRMVRRGIPAGPILNGYCGDYEVGMPALYSPSGFATSSVISIGLLLILSIFVF